MNKETNGKIKKMSEIDWKSFLDNFYQPIAIINSNGDHFYVNSAMCELLGYSEEELLKLGMKDTLDPILLETSASKLQKRLSRESLPFSSDVRLIHRNGTKLDVRATGHKVMWGDQPADLASFYDISSRISHENWIESKSKLTEDLRALFSVDLCFTRTCSFIDEVKLFKQTILVLDNDKGRLTNLGSHGIDNLMAARISIQNHFTAEEIRKHSQDKFKICNSYFFPNGTIPNIFSELNNKEARNSHKDLNIWQNGDLLLVPLIIEGKIRSGYLVANLPPSNIRPDIITVNKLEEIMVIVSKRLLEIRHQEIIFESELRYRTITEQSILPIAIYYRNRYTYVNPAFCELSGYEKDEILSWSETDSRKLTFPEDVEKINEFDKINGSNQSEISKISIRGIRKSGEIRFLERYAKEINFYGEISQLIILVDRTKEISFEKQLQINEEQFRALINAMRNAVLLIDKTGIILNLNKHYADIVGKSVDELRGKSIWDFLPEEIVEGHKREVTRVIETKQMVYLNEINGDKTYKTGVYPILNKEGFVDRVAVYIDDRTDELIASKKLADAEKMAAIGSLTSGIVHQIRNPLGNISFAAQLSLQEKDVKDPLKEYLELILQGVDNANSVIQKLTEYNNPQEIILTNGNILEPVYRAISYSETGCKSKDVKIKFNHPKKVSQMRISEYWLEQICINILNNSINAISQTGRIDITAAYAENRSKFTIEFLDNGCGIPSDIVNQVANPFFTTKADGIGLGLSMVSKIIEIHNGYMEIESEVGEYTRIILTFYMKNPPVDIVKLITFPF